MANTKLLKKVAKAIENEASRFNMATYFNYKLTAGEEFPLLNVCGTASCIAGHTIAVAYPEAVSRGPNMFRTDSYDRESGAYGSAMDLLDLTDEQAHWLFMGEFREGSMEHITRKQAIAAVQVLIDAPDFNPYNDDLGVHLVLFDDNGKEIENAIEEFTRG